MPMLNILSGKMNVMEGTASFYVTMPTKPRSPFVGTMADDRGTNGITRVGRSSSRSAVKYCDAEFVGNVVETAYEVRDGVILRITSDRQLGRLGTRTVSSINIRIREGAALRKVTAQAIEHEDRDFTQFHIFGRFDLLTPEEAEGYGAKIIGNNCDVDTARRVFGIETLADEESKAAKVSVATIAGEKIVVRKRTRNMNFDA